MFIYVHLFSFIFIYICSFCLIYFNFFSLVFHVLLFFSLEKAITNLNHLHVDPRRSSADNRHNCRSSNAGPIHLGNHRTRSRFHACASRYRPSLSVPRSLSPMNPVIVSGTDLGTSPYATNPKNCRNDEIQVVCL